MVVEAVRIAHRALRGKAQIRPGTLAALARQKLPTVLQVARGGRLTSGLRQRPAVVPDRRRSLLCQTRSPS